MVLRNRELHARNDDDDTRRRKRTTSNTVCRQHTVVMKQRTVRQGPRLLRCKGKQNRAQNGSLRHTIMTVSDSREGIVDANTLHSTQQVLGEPCRTLCVIYLGGCCDQWCQMQRLGLMRLVT